VNARPEGFRDANGSEQPCAHEYQQARVDQAGRLQQDRQQRENDRNLLSQPYQENTSEMFIVKQNDWCHMAYGILLSFSDIVCMGKTRSQSLGTFAMG